MIPELIDLDIEHDCMLAPGLASGLLRRFYSLYFPVLVNRNGYFGSVQPVSFRCLCLRNLVGAVRQYKTALTVTICVSRQIQPGDNITTVVNDAVNNNTASGDVLYLELCALKRRSSLRLVISYVPVLLLDGDAAPDYFFREHLRVIGGVCHSPVFVLKRNCAAFRKKSVSFRCLLLAHDVARACLKKIPGCLRVSVLVGRDLGNDIALLIFFKSFIMSVYSKVVVTDNLEDRAFKCRIALRGTALLAVSLADPDIAEVRLLDDLAGVLNRPAYRKVIFVDVIRKYLIAELEPFRCLGLLHGDGPERNDVVSVKRIAPYEMGCVEFGSERMFSANDAINCFNNPRPLRASVCRSLVVVPDGELSICHGLRCRIPVRYLLQQHVKCAKVRLVRDINRLGLTCAYRDVRD